MNPTDAKSIQTELFRLIKEKLSPFQSLVEVVAEVLSVSTDAAYRRIRGEKPLDLDEVLALSQAYHISIDGLQQGGGGQPGMVTFTFKTLDDKTFTLKEYFNAIIQQMYQIKLALPDVEVIYAAKDLPIFHYFNFPELAAFKLYVWKNALLGLPEYENKPFSIDGEDESMIALGRESLQAYSRFPSTELWNEETINSALRQVDYYFQSGQFKNPAEAHLLATQYLKLLEHIESMAASGRKFMLNDEAPDPDASYSLYNNEVVLCDNTSLVQMGQKPVVFLTHNTLNYIQITNPDYCRVSFQWAHTLIKRSTLLSSSNERQRREFFHRLKQKARHLMDQTR